MAAIQVMERPILFSGAMVRAILEDRKTQTRRVMKPQPFLERSEKGSWWLLDRSEDGYGPTNSAWREGEEPFWTYCPYGKPGDRLWVRESFRVWTRHIADSEDDIFGGKLTSDDSDRPIEYLADSGKDDLPWRPSIHMPRWASRLTLEIVSVKVERVQEISRNDAIAEGMTCDQFSDVWEQINGKRGFGWDKNPWVWCLTFKKVSGPERQVMGRVRG